MRYLHLACALTAASMAVAAPRVAEACGGVFPREVPGQPPEIITVTSQRIALSLSTEQSVLWSQIAYEGDPSDFAWVLPVGPGAVLEASTDAWFEALEAFTAPRVLAPLVTCHDDSGSGSSSGGCCGSAALDGGALSGRGNFGQGTPDVTVLHEGSVGNYQTVTLSSGSGEAIQTWLTTNGYAIPSAVIPVLDAYAAQGLDFIAMRLRPGASVSQMTPVRVVAPGGSPLVPLGMMAAGAGETVPLTLYVLGEGRYAPENFPSVTLDGNALRWDFAEESSNYETLRREELSREDRRGFLTSHVSQFPLVSPHHDPHGEMIRVTFDHTSSSATTIAEAYVLQHENNTGDPYGYCDLGMRLVTYPNLTVVETCPDGTREAGPCSDGRSVTAATFTCGDLSDVGRALIGLRPGDLVLTRLEADLPPSALEDDLRLEPASSQAPISSNLVAAKVENVPCGDYSVEPPGSEPLGRRIGNPAPAILAAALATAALRRRHRSRSR
ncbi:DUF2330 domain-containing protein [Chondromyces crocatus]|uniref:DUF2330 domain-containing protein n=1 Tax=Chondromyces crocatus TaxID=52 RepID=A0A0K1EHG7_CHOCO|nr:DUF2330 domain-containing protein [Chondromyces crocatus]AKT40299.1 uncharacterized protein CMC5_044520 [Chondromyces crocatus]